VQRWNLAEFGAWKTTRHEDPKTSNNDDYSRHTLINVCGVGLGNREMLISAQARKAVQGPAADAKEFRRSGLLPLVCRTTTIHYLRCGPQFSRLAAHYRLRESPNNVR
jgi:hypothetical protein